MADRTFTVATLSQAWECSQSVIRKLIGEGRLGHFRIGTLIRIPADEVARFECQNIASNDSAEGSPSSTGTAKESGTASGFEPETVLGRKRKHGEDGPPETVVLGPWGG